MAKIKFDGLIEAVRYAPDGHIDLVRAYERRGATFSDHILINRTRLVERLQKGEKFVTGQRKEFLGSTFESAKPVFLKGDIISTTSAATSLKRLALLEVFHRNEADNPTFLESCGTSASNRDLLEEVPVF